MCRVEWDKPLYQSVGVLYLLSGSLYELLQYFILKDTALVKEHMMLRGIQSLQSKQLH